MHKERGLTSYGHYGGNRLIIVNETDYYDTDSVINTNPKIVKMKVNNKFGNVVLKLCESTERLKRRGMLDVDSIEEIAIKFHNDIWYLCIIMENSDYKENSIKKISKINKRDRVGIDIGEENPIVCYDGKEIVNVPDNLLYPKDVITKINRRINNLRSVLNKKYNKSLAELCMSQSKGYNKIQQKIHKCYVKLFNIVKDWQFKLCKWIVSKYKTVVVDNFNNHIIRKNEGYLTRMRKDCNHSMLNKSMHYFMVRFEYMCKKYGTNYIESTKETTNKCSVCGHINIVQLKINEFGKDEYFICEKCGNIMQRDINASINCYYN